VLRYPKAIEELLDADPNALENRMSPLLRIEGAVHTPQKVDYIRSSVDAKGQGTVNLSLNRM
ncbi:unnamed protein product, partial [Choristocarpus tenellus]